MARHDRRRTAAATGTGNLTTPAAYWRAFLGGSLASDAMLVRDVDDDGELEFVYVMGGRVVAKHANDDLVWQSPDLGARSLLGIEDADGDGYVDVFVSSADHVYALAGPTGVVEWAEPDGDIGTFGAVRLADVTGDGRADVVVEECACCAIGSGNPGFVYSFGDGFASAKSLWKLPFAVCTGSNALAIADLNGDGKAEVVIADYTTLSALEGASGAKLATTPPIGNWTASSRCKPADVDGHPGDELICAVNSGLDPATDERRVFAAKYTDVPTPTFAQLWSFTVAPDAGGDMAWVDLVDDLDGNGTLEVVVAGQSAPDTWTTFILDARTGTKLAVLPGERASGTVPVGTAGTREVLTQSGTSLSGIIFDPTTAPNVKKVWSIADRFPFIAPDPAFSRLCGVASRVVSLDVDGDGASDLVTRTNGGQIEAFSLSGGSAKSIASFQLQNSADATAAWDVAGIDEVHRRLAVARSDGYLTILDQNLVPIDGGGAYGAGIRIGGYYAAGGWGDVQHTAVAAPLDGTGKDRILVADSRGALIRIDADAASLAVSPKKTWERLHTAAPSVIVGLDGAAPGIVAVGQALPVTTPPKYVIAGLRADGSTLWSRPTESVPLNDVLPGRIDSDAVPDLIYQWGDPGDVLLRTRAISGQDGSTLWDAVPIDPGAGRQSVGISVADWNGDSVDDVVFQAKAIRVLSGTDGSELASGGPSDSYYMPILSDLDGDGLDDVTLSGGYNPAKAIAHDLTTTLWSGAENDRPYPYGAVAGCPGGDVLVEGSWQYPARLKRTWISGPSSGASSPTVLAGGKQWVDEDAAKSGGSRLGQLTATNVHSNLTGKGAPSAVVGSSDGWLYAVNPCNGSLQFSVPFGAAVGEPIFADTDGDGLDEIVVSVADGYLYGLKNESIKAPSFVWDIDPAKGITTHDVADIETADTLAGRWGAVAGAVSYRVAIVDAQDAFVTSPPWQDVGATTETSISGLPLSDGATYKFAVRSVGSDGVSADAETDGVTVHFPPSVDGGTDADAADGDSDAGAEAASDASADSEVDASPDSGVEASPEDALLSGRACTCTFPGAGVSIRSDWGRWGLVVLLGAAISRRRRGV